MLFYKAGIALIAHDLFETKWTNFDCESNFLCYLFAESVCSEPTSENCFWFVFPFARNGASSDGWENLWTTSWKNWLEKKFQTFNPVINHCSKKRKKFSNLIRTKDRLSRWMKRIKKKNNYFAFTSVLKCQLFIVTLVFLAR